MQNLSLNTGEIRLTINDDPNRVIRFNPNDILFAQKFYRLLQNYKKMFEEYADRVDELEADVRVDGDGVFLNTQERLDVLKEACERCYGEIDILFGEGTSATVFEGVYSFEAVGQFFDGVTPYFGRTRGDKVQKYLPKKSSRVSRKKK